jgi:hypothetical protein
MANPWPILAPRKIHAEDYTHAEVLAELEERW